MNDTPKNTKRRKQFDLAPSERRRPTWVKAPHGMIDVWRVSHMGGTAKWTLVGFYKKEDNAWVKADDLWTKGYREGLRVEHKAGISVNGKMYLVNIQPIQFADETRPPFPSSEACAGAGQDLTSRPTGPDPDEDDDY